MLPEVVFIGPARSGTTWIDAYLRSRGDVMLPGAMKETFFFDKKYDRGIGWYERQFATACPRRRCVEVAPSLFHKPEVTPRVAADLPDVHVIVTLRDPVQRAVSHYFHYRGAGERAIPFYDMALRRPDILEAGMYHKHLARWRDVLGGDRIHVLLFDDLRRDPSRFCTRLCSLLDLNYVEPDQDALASETNASTLPPLAGPARLMFRTVGTLRRMGADPLVNALRTPALKRLVYGAKVDEEARQKIAAEAEAHRHLFRDDVEQLEALLGLDLAAWK